MKNAARSGNLKSGFLPVIAALFIIATLASCPAPMAESGGGEGTIAIAIGDGGARAGMWMDPSALSHTITLSDGPGPVQKQEGIKSGQTARFSVSPGRWLIQVEAYDGGVLKAEGTASETVQGGKSVTVSVRMDPVLPPDATENDLQSLINGAENGAVIRLSGTITIKDKPRASALYKPNKQTRR